MCQRLPIVGPTIGSFSATPASSIRDLGVYIDSDLSMRSHVQRTVSRFFATLRHLRTLRRQVPTIRVPVTGHRACSAGLRLL